MTATTTPISSSGQDVQDKLMLTRITEQLLRKRAEHNEGMLSNLEEVALHQQNLGRIELLGQLCPKLKILYLQNNLISKLQNLHKLKELQYLNMAVNNLTKVENLQRCESLTKLDLTVNFIGKAGLLTFASLKANHNLRELTVMGNSCAEWSGCRPYIVAQLPQLKRLDGQDIKPSERIAAQQLAPELMAELHADLIKEGIDPDKAAEVEDDSLLYDEATGELQETGTVDEATGEVRRPWCPATRILDHMENEKANRAAESKKAAGRGPGDDLDASSRPQRLDDFSELKEGERVMQRNEGQWDFSIDEGAGSGSLGRCLLLEVDVGKYLDTSLIKADVQPTYVRLLIKGKLLQLLLPCEVRPDASCAQRSQATGRLVLQMPKAQPDAQLDITLARPRKGPSDGTASFNQQQGQQHLTSSCGSLKPVGARSAGIGPAEFVIREARKAVVQEYETVANDDDDFIPALS